MKAMMRQAQQMQKKLNQAQDEVAEMSYTATAGGGMVTAVVKGDMTVQSLEISPVVVDPDDIEMLQDLVVAAINDAFLGMNEMASQHINEATGGMGGGSGLPGM